MTWHDGLEQVFTLDADTRGRVGRHVASLGDSSAAPLPEPELESPGGTVEATRFAFALGRGELIDRFGVGPEACVIDLDGSEELALVDDAGGPLGLVRGFGSIDCRALAKGLGSRPVLLCGRPGQLIGFFDRMRAVNERFGVVGVVATRLPTPENITSRLARYWEGAVVLDGVADCRRGGWLLLSRTQRGPLMPVRAWDEFRVWSREGPVMPESWGFLAHIRASGAIDVFHHYVRQGHDHVGQVSFETKLPELAVGDIGIDTGELSQRLRSLPVFSYQIILGPQPKLRMSPMPEIGERTAPIDEALADLEGLELSYVEAQVDLDSPMVYDPTGSFGGEVWVMFAGEPGAEARRLGWCEAIRASGLIGRSLELIDAASGEPVTGLAAEALAAMAADEEPLAALYPEASGRRRIYLGDPREAAELGLDDADEVGWITLLEADEAREAMFVAGPRAREVGVVAGAFADGKLDAETAARIEVMGIYLQSYSRPMLALGRGPGKTQDAPPLALDAERCTGAGDCARICPTDAIAVEGEPARPVIDASACVRCMLCVERCDSTALRPVMSIDGGLSPEVFIREAEQLTKLRARKPARALEGKLVEPPARLDARIEAPAIIRNKPTVVLGLATVTLMEHTAALLVDGELVSAIEEERLVRERHYRWKHPTRPGVSLSSDICLKVEEAWPPRAIDAVLRTAGLTLDDVDIVALNGIPGRFRRTFEGGWNWRAPPVLRANSMVFVPHHMSHAASVYGLSDMDEAWILSVDGRGDYETATVWRAEGHAIDIVDAVPWRPDCSFGGVYETVTRALGFGTHGQGSTMALAAYGEPSVDVSSCMSISPGGRPLLSENAAEKLVIPYERGYDDPLEDKHFNLAASIQLALESTVGDYLEHHAGDLRGKKLALCGGVALNCRMNGVLRERFQPAVMHVPPGANDAGTAIGAAMIGHRELTGELPRLGLGHTHFGPAWPDDAIAASLKRMRVPFQRLRRVGEQVADLLVAGKVVCWFQGPMEFGPRALGGRSITADPRRPELKDRLNKMKSRQDWRPFGPSVLAGHQSEWFVQDWDSRYMLFAVDVRPDKRDQIPVVVHHDGSTRPQMVHAEHQPRYHALISAFAKQTGVPMIVNTSFNRGGEPIVCNPAEALRSFVGLGADAIVLGDCLVRREMLVRR